MASPELCLQAHDRLHDIRPRSFTRRSARVSLERAVTLLDCRGDEPMVNAMRRNRDARASAVRVTGVTYADPVIGCGRDMSDIPPTHRRCFIRSSASVNFVPARKTSSPPSWPARMCWRSCRPAAASRFCYQLPAIARPGLTLVVSPLIALMRDQVRALTAVGGSLRAASTRRTNGPRTRACKSGLCAGASCAYVAPEGWRGLTRSRCWPTRRPHDGDRRGSSIACRQGEQSRFRPEYLALGNLARQIGGSLSQTFWR